MRKRLLLAILSAAVPAVYLGACNTTPTQLEPRGAGQAGGPPSFNGGTAAPDTPSVGTTGVLVGPGA